MSEQGTGFINSSFTILFHVAAIAYAPYFASKFPANIHNEALIACILIPISIYWIVYFINSHTEAHTILSTVILFFSLVAVGRFFDAVYGPIVDGLIPVISVVFFGPYVYSSSGLSPIYISTLFFYGIVSYAWALLVAWLLEFAYAFAHRKILPKMLRVKLDEADKRVDIFSSNFFSREFLPMGQTIGGIIAFILISLYFFLYVILAIKYY